MTITVGIAGLSHLGIVTGVCLAECGFKVLGFDADHALTERLGNLDFPVFEPKLEALAQEHLAQLSFSSDPGELSGCNIIYLAQDVPTDSTGTSDLAPIKILFEQVLEVAKPGTVLVLHSQVSPGFSRMLLNRFQQALKSKQLCLVYQVETLVFGNAVERATQPERYIVGLESADSPVPPALKAVLDARPCEVLVMNFESAELAKTAINLFLVSSVSTTNLLADICERIGAQWSSIEAAVRLDKRIGKYAYVRPGLGISGGNLERDLKTVQMVANQMGADSQLIDSWRALSDYQAGWVLRHLYAQVLHRRPTPQLAFLGLAYKPGTHSLKNAPAIDLLRQTSNFPSKVFDPKAVLPSSEFPNAAQVPTVLQCLKGASCIIVLTPWDEIRSLTVQDLRSACDADVLIDPYACFNVDEAKRLNFRYFTLGRAPS